MFATGAAIRAGRHVQPLSYEPRLPDAVQAAALRLLDASRAVTNATVAALWERLDDFGERESKYAYKQVTAPMGSPAFHGDRQWRCEAEQAGRILRGRAARKKQFARVPPLLEQSLIEQACNFYLKHGCFPDSYEETQTNPLLKVGVLPYAGDDGAKF